MILQNPVRQVSSCNALETSTIVNEQVEPDALSIPLHWFEFQDDRKGVSHINRDHAEIFKDRDLFDDRYTSSPFEHCHTPTYRYFFHFHFHFRLE